GQEEGVLHDLHRALVAAFLGEIVVADAAALATLRETGAIYLANHQTAVESLCLGLALGTLGVPTLLAVAKIEHGVSWIGGLRRWAARYPGATPPLTTLLFDRSDLKHQAAVLAEIEPLLRGGDSLLVHVDGTRARRAGAPVVQVGGSWIDLAL